MQTSILIVEDEPGIRDMIRFALEQKQFHVVTADSVSTASDILRDASIDAALIDWMLPGASGIHLIKQLRKNESTAQLPIIMITAKTDEADISQGLDAGADDYITKPFSPKELISRLNALLRRSNQFKTNDIKRLGDLVVDNIKHRVSVAETTIELGQIEFKLLNFLIQRPEQVFSRSQLLDGIWGHDSDIEERTVDVHILRLRKALKPVQHDSIIETVRGVGYRILSIRRDAAK